MFRSLGLYFGTLVRLFCSRHHLLLENLALRQQLVVGVGNNSKTHAAKGVTVKEFAGSDPKGCTGFDNKYNALMVPQTPNSNTFQIRVAKGLTVTLIPSTNINAVTFAPSYSIQGDGQFHQLTVSGAKLTPVAGPFEFFGS